MYIRVHIFCFRWLQEVRVVSFIDSNVVLCKGYTIPFENWTTKIYYKIIIIIKQRKHLKFMRFHFRFTISTGSSLFPSVITSELKVYTFVTSKNISFRRKSSFLSACKIWFSVEYSNLLIYYLLCLSYSKFEEMTSIYSSMDSIGFLVDQWSAQSIQSGSLGLVPPILSRSECLARLWIVPKLMVTRIRRCACPTSPYLCTVQLQ